MGAEVAVGARKRFRPDRGVWSVRYSGGGQRSEVVTGRGEEGESIADALVADEVEREARAARISRAAARGAGWERDQLTVADLLRHHADTHLPALSRGTAATHRSLIERHLIPRLGAVPLLELGRPDLRRFALEIGQAGRSPALLDLALGTLRRAVNLAVEARLLRPRTDERDAEVVDAFGIVRELVQQLARSRTGDERAVDAWTRREVAALLDLARKHEPALAGPFLCAVQTGARRGAVLGLEWPDVDFERGVVRFRRQETGQRESKRGKWGRGHVSPMPRELREELERLAGTRRRREPWKAPGVVFRSPQGKRWDPRNFSRAWDRLRAKALEAGIRPLHFHCTKHTFVTWALDARRSPRWVAESVGTSMQVILRVYAHVLRGGAEDASFAELGADEPRREGRV